MPTTNQVPSTDPSDLLFNAGKLDEVVSGSSSTYTDRLGISRRTMAGIDAAADLVLSGLGYAPPVAYAAGISLTLTTQTVEYAGEVYAPKVANLPFTTSGTFETAKFRLIQGVASADLASGGGAAMVGYTPAGTGAVATTVQSKLLESVSVFDFMTAAEKSGCIDGSVDVTAAVKKALDAADSIYFPRGVYLIGETIYTRGAINQINGRYKGKSLFGSGIEATIIKAKSGFVGDVLIHVGNKDYPSDAQYCVQNHISDMAFDIDNLANNTSTSAILTQGTFNNTFSNLRVGLIESPRARWDINVNRGTYTTTFNDVHCGQIQCSSASVGDVTTVWFVGCSATFVNLHNSNAVSFDHFTMQGEPAVQYQTNRFQISQCNNISVVNGDLEGNGKMFVVNSSNGVEITGNNVAMNGSYTPFGGSATSSTFISAENCTEIKSRGNIFMNWVKGPLTPAAGIYLSEPGAANRMMNVYDFHGDSFTGARYRHNGGATIPAGSAQVINFSVADFDTGTQVMTAFPEQSFAYTPFVTTGANWVFLAPLRGYYEVDSSVILSGLNPASDVAFIVVYVGGVEYARSYGNISAGGSAQLQMQTSVFANTGVEIQIKVFHNGSGTVQTLTSSTAHSAAITFKGAR